MPKSCILASFTECIYFTYFSSVFSVFDSNICPKTFVVPHRNTKRFCISLNCWRVFLSAKNLFHRNDNTSIDELPIILKQTVIQLDYQMQLHCTTICNCKNQEHTHSHTTVIYFQFDHLIAGELQTREKKERKKQSTTSYLEVWLMPCRNTFSDE